MKDREVRQRLDGVQDQIRVRYCDTCQLYTLQHLTIKTLRGGHEAVVIPDKIGDATKALCANDEPCWYCLHCNNISLA